MGELRANDIIQECVFLEKPTLLLCTETHLDKTPCASYLAWLAWE